MRCGIDAAFAAQEPATSNPAIRGRTRLLKPSALGCATSCSPRSCFPICWRPGSSSVTGRASIITVSAALQLGLAGPSGLCGHVAARTARTTGPTHIVGGPTNGAGHGLCHYTDPILDLKLDAPQSDWFFNSTSAPSQRRTFSAGRSLRHSILEPCGNPCD